MTYLTEDLTKGPNDADNTFGWAKLMGEFTLEAGAKEYGTGLVPLLRMGPEAWKISP